MFFPHIFYLCIIHPTHHSLHYRHLDSSLYRLLGCFEKVLLGFERLIHPLGRLNNTSFPPIHSLKRDGHPPPGSQPHARLILSTCTSSIPRSRQSNYLTTRRCPKRRCRRWIGLFLSVMYAARPNGADSATINPAALSSPG